MPNKVSTIFIVGMILVLVPIQGTASTYDFISTDRPSWRPFISTGFDATIHTYPLANQDTTETISEFRVKAGIEGRSKRKTSHRWLTRVDASSGSEMYRQRLEGSYRFLSSGNQTRLHLKGYFRGRQFKKNTTYSASSDNYEGRLDLRLFPLVGNTTALELRGWSSLIDYKTPSTLETDNNDLGMGAFLRSQGFNPSMWSLGVRGYSRDYPDSTSIGRDVVSFEGDYDRHKEGGQGFSVFQKSERRLAADETIRPSAWTHWTDFEGAIGAGKGLVFLEFQFESWTYDQEDSAYFNSSRVDGKLGYRAGDILGIIWHTGFAAEKMDAGDSPETYAQLGLIAGIESYGSVVSGSVDLEYGRRQYANPTIDLTDYSDYDSLETIINLYSDFNYWQVWIMGSWFLNDHFSLDVMASYEPESHTEQDDDSALGFGSLRITWRP